MIAWSDFISMGLNGAGTLGKTITPKPIKVVYWIAPMLITVVLGYALVIWIRPNVSRVKKDKTGLEVENEGRTATILLSVFLPLFLALIVALISHSIADHIINFEGYAVVAAAGQLKEIIS